MEKHEMVAVHASIRYEKNDPYNGVVEDASGTSWLLNGLAMRTGPVKERNIKHLKTRIIRYFCVEERKPLNKSEKRRKLKTKLEECWTPRTKQFTFVKEDPQCIYVVTVRWQENGSMAVFSGTEVQRTNYSWKRKIANPISKIDDYVKHIFREHNHEAEHWANFGAEGQRKIIVDRSNNAEAWQVVKGFWMAAPRTTVEVAVES